MACFHPLPAWRLSSGEVVFVERGDVVGRLDLPCGQCIGCRLERSRQWAVRLVHEAACWDSSVFVTLTYDDDHLPPLGALRYSDVQGFLKRIRSRLRERIRFFAVGEYGETTARPHYHIILFNCFLSDSVLYSRGDYPLYESRILSDCWGFGSAVFGAVTFESAAYCARYCVGKLTGDPARMSDELRARHAARYARVDGATGELVTIPLEFAHMSLKPGIGATWLDRFTSDVYPRDEVVMRGRVMKPPRYYDRRALASLDCADDVVFQRQLDAAKNFHDNTTQRLEVKEKVAAARLALSSRSTV